MRQPTEQIEAFAWYFAALKHGAGSPQAPIHADEPQCGYFRLKAGNGIYLPTYIGMESPVDPETGELEGDERMICNIAKVVRDPHDAWTYVAGHPVAYEAFKQAWETGKWPDEAPGENFQPADSLEGAIDQLEAMLANVARFKEIETQMQCDQAANLKDRLMETGKALEAMQKVELEPIRQAGYQVHEKYDPWLVRLRGGIDFLRDAMKPYFDRAREAAKAATVQAGGEGAARALDVHLRAGGMSGRRTYERTDKIPIIKDYEAALAYVKNDKEIRLAVEKVVKRIIKAGGKVPGVEIREETKVI